MDAQARPNLQFLDMHKYTKSLDCSPLLLKLKLFDVFAHVVICELCIMLLNKVYQTVYFFVSIFTSFE